MAEAAREWNADVKDLGEKIVELEPPSGERTR